MGPKDLERIGYTPFEFRKDFKIEPLEPILPLDIFKHRNEVVNIKDYIINENATVIFWEDGTKTVVKKTKEDKFDKRLGLLIGYFQKNCGMSKTKANKFLDNLVVTEKTKKEK